MDSSPASSRNVLCVVHTQVSLDYLAPHVELLATMPQVRVTWTVAHDRYALAEPAVRAQVTGPLIPFASAVSKPWDMVLFGAHGDAHLFAGSPRVHVPHGLGSGKRALGDNYTYGATWTARGGQCIYEVMLEASDAERCRFEELFGHLCGRIKVVGDLRADRLRILRADRASVRQRMGIPSDHYVLLITSTWGPHSFVARALGTVERCPVPGGSCRT